MKGTRRPIPRAALAAILAGAALFAASCATRPPIVVSFPAGRSVTSPKGPARGEPPGTVEVPLTDYRDPKEPAPSSSSADPQAVVRAGDLRFEVRPEEEDYVGGAVVYNYVPNHVYELFVAPLELTVIELEPGERVVAPPAAGDTSSFIVGESFDVEEGARREQLLVKAVYPGRRTTLAVNTDRRSYLFRVVSSDETWMPLVSFSYPLDFAERMSREAASEIPTYGSIEDLDFGYDIVAHAIPTPSWAPSIVFSDGRRTYIDFASASRAAYAPVLFEVDRSGERLLVNYRVVGSYYVVDRVLDEAELVLDVNKGEIVTIKRRSRHE